MTPIEIICVIGWGLASLAAYCLFTVSRALGQSAQQNRRLLDELAGAQQGERFWRSMAQPAAYSEPKFNPDDEANAPKG